MIDAPFTGLIVIELSREAMRLLEAHAARRNMQPDKLAELALESFVKIQERKLNEAKI